jgi:hypothetical protein
MSRWIFFMLCRQVQACVEMWLNSWVTLVSPCIASFTWLPVNCLNIKLSDFNTNYKCGCILCTTFYSSYVLFLEMIIYYVSNGCQIVIPFNIFPRLSTNWRDRWWLIWHMNPKWISLIPLIQKHSCVFYFSCVKNSNKNIQKKAWGKHLDWSFCLR